MNIIKNLSIILVVYFKVDIAVKLDVELGQVAATHTEEHSIRVNRPATKILHLNLTVVSKQIYITGPRIHLCFSILRFTAVNIRKYINTFNIIV